MSDLTWGAEIAVNGVRPAWLRDDDRFQVFSEQGKWSEPYDTAGIALWNLVEAISLPADHPYYRATEAGFTYWPGGEEAPADWDGGEVLLRNGRAVLHTESDWAAYQDWLDTKSSLDIIGYHRKPVDPYAHTDGSRECRPVPVDWSKPIEAVHADGRVEGVRLERGPDSEGKCAVYDEPRDAAIFYNADGSPFYDTYPGWRIRNVAEAPALPTYDPTTHVAVRLMDESQARAWADEGVSYGTSAEENAIISALRVLGVVRSTPTPAEAFATKHGLPLAVVEAFAAEVKGEGK